MNNQDNILSNAEDILRGYDYSLPLAWCLGFLIDNETALISALEDAEHDELARQVKGIVHEILTGEIL